MKVGDRDIVLNNMYVHFVLLTVQTAESACPKHVNQRADFALILAQGQYSSALAIPYYNHYRMQQNSFFQGPDFGPVLDFIYNGRHDVETSIMLDGANKMN